MWVSIHYSDVQCTRPSTVLFGMKRPGVCAVERDVNDVPGLLAVLLSEIARRFFQRSAGRRRARGGRSSAGGGFGTGGGASSASGLGTRSKVCPVPCGPFLVGLTLPDPTSRQNKR